MLEFNGQPVYNSHGVIEYYRLYATKNNGVRVEFDLTKDELKTLIDKVEKTKTVEEAKERIVKDYIKEELKQDPSRLNELKSLVDRWSVDFLYTPGDIVTYNGVLFRAKKAHKASYENIPVNEKDLWEEVVEEDTTKSQEELDYEIKKNSAEFYSADKTYNKGDLVVYYHKLYESNIDKNTANPEKSKTAWTLIPAPGKETKN